MNTPVATLIIAIICMVGFVQTIRLGHHLRLRMSWVGTVNYAWATVIAGVLWLADSSGRCGWTEVLLGGLMGGALVASYYMLTASVSLVGAGVTQVIDRVSGVLLPTLAAMIFWDGAPTIIKLIGLAVALVSFVLIAQGHVKKKSQSAPRGKVILIITFMTGITGLLGILLKVYAVAAGESFQPMFFCCMYGSAAITNLFSTAREPEITGRGELFVGVLLGTANITATIAFYLALTNLDGIIVYPTTSAGSIVLATAASWFLWKERYNRWTLAGIIVAVVALVLVNWPG